MHTHKSSTQIELYTDLIESKSVNLLGLINLMDANAFAIELFEHGYARERSP